MVLAVRPVLPAAGAVHPGKNRLLSVYEHGCRKAFPCGWCPGHTPKRMTVGIQDAPAHTMSSLPLALGTPHGRRRDRGAGSRRLSTDVDADSSA